MSASLTDINRLRIVKIQKVKRWSDRVKTLTFEDEFCSKAEPGQFIMVWIPKVDEIPMSLSAMSLEGKPSITVARVGEATEALHKRKIGDTLGIRGPYGNSFTPTNGSTMIVGGGTGMSPLTSLIKELVELRAKVSLVIGAKTQDELLFLERITSILSKTEGKVVAATEDGSYGMKRLATDAARQLIKKERFDMIYTCGPEAMMYQMFVLAEKHETPIQVSLERLMRCAIGICGSCVIGRFRVCRDGPVFSNEQLGEIKEEFGRLRRRSTGQEVPI